MRVFGTILPYVGFKTVIHYDSVFLPTLKIKLKLFVVEWFKRGFAILYSTETTPMFEKSK
tara:strand:+ start:474 stop:653 length:180 start_codon:yes stop_codon:yes gene_type:complete